MSDLISRSDAEHFAHGAICNVGLCGMDKSPAAYSEAVLAAIASLPAAPMPDDVAGLNAPKQFFGLPVIVRDLPNDVVFELHGKHQVVSLRSDGNLWTSTPPLTAMQARIDELEAERA